MSRLSFNLKIGINSTNVIIKENKIIIIGEKFVNKLNMIIVDKKKENDPSRDLLNKIVFPYFIPINAAAESDKLKTNREMIAICSLKNNVDNIMPINTHVEPETELISFFRVTFLKNLK